MATYSTADIWHFGHGQMLPLLVSPRRALSHRTWNYDPGDADDVKVGEMRDSLDGRTVSSISCLDTCRWQVNFSLFPRTNKYTAFLLVYAVRLQVEDQIKGETCKYIN